MHPKRPAARSLSEKNRWQELLGYTENWRREEPSCYLADYYAGVANNGLGLHEIALRCYINAIEKDASDPHVFMNIAVTYQDMDMPEQAIPYMRQVVVICPDDTHLLNAFGHLLGLAKRPGEAADCFSRILDIKPKDEGALDFYIKAMLESQRTPELLDKLPSLRKRFPGHNKTFDSIMSRGPLFSYGKWELRDFVIDCGCALSEADPQNRSYVHLFHGKYIHAEIDRVWCHSCGTFTAAAKIPEVASSSSIREKISATEKNIEEVERDINRPSWTKWLGKPIDYSGYDSLKRSIENLENSLCCSLLAESMNRVNSGRRRCLCCAEANTALFVPPEKPETSLTPIGRSCKRCNKELMWKGKWVFPERTFHNMQIYPDVRHIIREFVVLDDGGRVIKDRIDLELGKVLWP